MVAGASAMLCDPWGFAARGWERLKSGSGDYDITRNSVQRGIRQDMSKGLVCVAMFAPPCASFSSINRHVHRPPPHPWGDVPQASAKAEQSIANGNACVRAAIYLMNCCERHQISYVFEHPQSGRCSKFPVFQKFIELPHNKLYNL